MPCCVPTENSAWAAAHHSFISTLEVAGLRQCRLEASGSDHGDQTSAQVRHHLKISKSPLFLIPTHQGIGNSSFKDSALREAEQVE